MDLRNSVLLGVLSFLLSYILTPMTIPLCYTVGAIDMPDGARKVNTLPIPRLGGLGFFFATMLVLFPYVGKSPTTGALLAGGAILMAGGIADDVFSLSPITKLFIQAAAALVSLSFIGIPDELTFFGILNVPLHGSVGFLIVFFRMVFTVNAVNFSDGLDGLASGLSAVALFSLAAYGIALGNTLPATAALVLGAATLGFMPFNRYRAKVFMGDCGSQFLGLSIALLSLGTSPAGNFTLETALFLFVPTLDTVITVTRRILTGKSPFSADKGHLHHILLSFGISHPNAVKILVSVSALIAAATLIMAM